MHKMDRLDIGEKIGKRTDFYSGRAEITGLSEK